jgi:hypothetical protein
VAMKRTHPSADLVRTHLKAEERIRRYEPKPRDEPPPPPCAESVLCALAMRHQPGEAVGLQEIVDASGCTWAQASATRSWAKTTGAWPYLQPGLCRPPQSRKPKGGGS